MTDYRGTFFGEVVPGKKLGRTIGFPTANIQVLRSNGALHRGVYGVFVKYKQRIYKGIMNIGTCPTFKGMSQGQTVEVHILDFEGNIYGEFLTICIVCLIRGEKAFPSINLLIEQLQKDKELFQQQYANQSQKEMLCYFDQNIDEIIHLPDLMFSQYCLNYYTINKGVYNTIENWFYTRGILRIEERRMRILDFFDYVQQFSSPEIKLQFGPGRLRTLLDMYWNSEKLDAVAVST